MLCLHFRAVGKREFIQLHHIDLWKRKDGERMETELLGEAPTLVPKETQVNRFIPQNMMDLRQFEGQRNTGSMITQKKGGFRI